MIVRAQVSSLAAVTDVAQGASLPRAVALAVARWAIPAATVMCALIRPSSVGCWAASLPNPFPSTSDGRSLAGWVVSCSRSRTVLLYSKLVSRRTSARPGRTAGCRHAAETPTPAVPVLAPADPPPPVTPPAAPPPLVEPDPAVAPDPPPEPLPMGAPIPPIFPEQPTSSAIASGRAVRNRSGSEILEEVLSGGLLIVVPPRPGGPMPRGTGRRRQWRA